MYCTVLQMCPARLALPCISMTWVRSAPLPARTSSLSIGKPRRQGSYLIYITDHKYTIYHLGPWVLSLVLFLFILHLPILPNPLHESL